MPDQVWGDGSDLVPKGSGDIHAFPLNPHISKLGRNHLQSFLSPDIASLVSRIHEGGVKDFDFMSLTFQTSRKQRKTYRNQGVHPYVGIN